MYTVYKHTCPNGKVYIGITSLEPEERWHNGRGYSNNRHFFNAIIKYGWDNIEHSILHKGLAQCDAQRLEAQYIAQYRSDNPQYGYNHTVGGEVSIIKFKPIAQYDKAGTLIAEYPSLKAASEMTGINSGSICCACQGKRKSAGNYIWKYKEIEKEVG